MHTVILGFVSAFAITFLAIPSIIGIARHKSLFDLPNLRSAHQEPTPSLGGIGIFAGTVCSILLWTPFTDFADLQYILAAMVVLMLIGVKDDLYPISPTKKLIGQLLAAVILVYKSHIRLGSLHGVFGIHELPDLTAFFLSIGLIVAIINAFNLIDGINGLAGGVGLLASFTWGAWFFYVDSPALAVVAFSLCGALVAFLKYNVSPAKIFMGDTGSMLIGMVCAILAIKFIELSYAMPYDSTRYTFSAAPAIAVSILIVPVYDTLRVFVRRLWQGRSPFYPDRSHIHHLLLDRGLNHMQSTAVLLSCNVLFVVLAIALHRLGTVRLLLVELALAMLLTLLLNRVGRQPGPQPA